MIKQKLLVSTKTGMHDTPSWRRTHLGPIGKVDDGLAQICPVEVAFLHLPERQRIHARDFRRTKRDWRAKLNIERSWGKARHQAIIEGETN